ITAISDSALKQLELKDNNGTTSLYKDKSNVFYVIYRPTKKVIIKSMPEAEGKIIANRLNLLFAGLYDDPIRQLPDNELERIAVFTLKNPSWTEIHLAAALGLTRTLSFLFERDAVVVVNTPTEDGLLPLHIACEYNQYEAAMLCTKAGAQASKMNARGQTAYHLAAKKWRYEINEAQAIQLCVTAEDMSGFTPLQEAICNENLEGLQVILLDVIACRGARNQVLRCLQHYVVKDYDKWRKIGSLVCSPQLDWLIQMDPSGDTILHKPLPDPDILRVLCLFAARSCFELPNGSGLTPLQAAINRDDLAACVCFVSFGADVGKKTARGETCAQLALQKARPMILQLLILLGAQMDPSDLQFAQEKHKPQLRKIFQTALEPKLQEAMRDHLLPDNTIKIRDALMSKPKTNRKIALSLDGGGIRGLVEAQMLFELERLTGNSIVSNIEWLGGTSTGSILAIGLALGRSPADCIRLYLRFKDEVFRGIRPYSPKTLEACLIGEFGPDRKFGDVKKRLLVTAAQVDVSPAEIVLFRSYDLPNEPAKNFAELGNGREIKLWQAARCSSAAPTYFTAPFGVYMDGGLIANNPSAEILSDIQMMETLGVNEEKPSLFLSLGTGIPPLRRMNENQPNGGIWQRLNQFNLNLMHTLHMLTEQISAANGVIVSRSAGFSLALGIPFFRFSPPLPSDIQLDARDDEILIEMLWIARNYIYTHPDIKKLCEYLKQ
ncbi:unnamed protein product, partial [Mesorhabditis belari]|uniref:phospholipase A2 n=1 Tax=Mesorhabditis belari TaxID=2138241 RepID=A0AAF3J694_9BILA